MNRLPSQITHERAVISDCGLYRYLLSREVSPTSKFKPVVFVMLNPSTANAEQNDPTIRRCIDYTKRWGGSHLIVVNLFAYRSKDPFELWAEDTVDPVGVLNDEALIKATDYAHAHDGIVVAAWGEHGSYMGRSDTVLGTIAQYKPMCLKLNKSGNPAHPLYQPKDAVLIAVKI